MEAFQEMVVIVKSYCGMPFTLLSRIFVVHKLHCSTFVPEWIRFRQMYRTGLAAHFRAPDVSSFHLQTNGHLGEPRNNHSNSFC